MPFAMLTILALVGADPDRPEVFVETSAGSPIPVASAARGSTPPEALSGDLRGTAPTVKREQERQLQRLHVQRAMSDARRRLEGDAPAEAIKILETHLAHAGGSDDYLELLDAAYRRQLASLVKTGRADEASLLEERRRVLSSRTADEQPLTAAVAAIEPARVEKGDSAATPKKSTKGGGLGGAIFGQFFGKNESAKTEDDKVVVRARWDHRDPSVNEPERKQSQPVAERTDSPAETAELGELQLAEKHWKERNFLRALVHYEAAYRANPDGAVQQARDRFGYCLLWAAYSKYEPKTADVAAPIDDQFFEAWEADVKQGRQLCRIESFRKFADDQLNLLEERRQARYRPAAPSGNAAVNPAVVAPASKPSAPTRVAANVAYRHLAAQHQGGWRVTETENFRIVHKDVALAEEVAVIAETARRQAHELWFAAEPLQQWTPKCDLVLYPTAQEFAQQTNQMPNSPAFTQCDVHNGWVASRRIELRTDEPNMKNGILPHEIAHAVFAGQFAGRSPPKWADEGMAVMTEPEDIQNRHLVGLVQARSGGRGMGCDRLLPMQSYPPQVQEFYAHSVGVCRMLVERHGGRERLVQFVRTAVETNDYEGALFRIYQIRGLKDLETRFQQFVGELRTAGYASR
jgi:hypothetical protein